MAVFMSSPGGSRRPHGTGSLYVRADGAGRESWYGQWRARGVRHKRCIGPKRRPGSRDGLTRTQAEAKLRRFIAEAPAPRPTIERLTLAEAAPRYLANLRAKGRKPSTLVAAESCLSVWLLPTLGDRALDAIRGEGVEDLMARMEAGDRPDRREGTRSKPCGPKTIRNYMGTLSAIYPSRATRGGAGRPPTRSTTSTCPTSRATRTSGSSSRRSSTRSHARRWRAPTTRSTGRSTSRQR